MADLKIIHFEADNVKRLRRVEITPNSNMVVVGGKNEAGKTSTLDCIEWALRGARAFGPVPVRVGEEGGRIFLDMGDITVTRLIKPDGSHEVHIRNAEGLPPAGAPQQLLDKLFSKLSFDPISFLKMEGKDQAKVIKGLIPFDFAGYEARRKMLEEERKFTKRNHDDKQAENKALPYDPSATLELQSTAQVMEEMRLISEQQTARLSFVNTIERGKANIARIDAQIALLVGERKQITDWLEANEPKLADFPDRSTAELEASLTEIQTHNQTVSRNKQAKMVFEALTSLEDNLKRLNLDIAQVDRDVAQAIANAKLPIDGLGFSEHGITFNDIPFEQLSGAQRLKVSIAMGIALNPTLKVLLIRDGSLLDDDNMAVVSAMAEQYGCQIWVERVGNGAECSVVIDDGMILEDRTK